VNFETDAYATLSLQELAELADTEADCVDKEPTKNAVAVESWDEVAAVLVGSLEARFRGGLVDLQDGYCFEICPINSDLIKTCALPITMDNWKLWTVPICVGRSHRWNTCCLCRSFRVC
jgi:hypothetical protein